MLRLIETFQNLPVLSLRTNEVIAMLDEPIINPDNLKIIGWYCTDRFGSNKSILLTNDIREIIPRGMIVNDSDSLSDPEDLVRLRDILELSFSLVGKKVVTEHKRKVGKVTDYAIDVDSMTIQKLHIQQSLIRSINGGRVIDRKQVIEVSDTYIVVKDSDIKVTDSIQSLTGQPVSGSYSSPASTSLIKE